VGHVVYKNLLNSKHEVFPVNPKTNSILGNKCYKNIVELKGKVSHVVIAVPAKIIPMIINECGVAGVKEAFIISAGFSESGNKFLEEKLVKTARDNGIRILGPNILGVIVPESYNASFFTGELKSGGVSFISQSGALGVAVLDVYASEGWPLRSFISIGNASDITITDALNKVINDKRTKCILAYIESLKDGPGFMKACNDSKKPIFIVKAGISKAGQRASATHTGALAGSDEVYDAAFKQCGAIRIDSLKSLLNVGLVCEKHGLIGNKALIITNAGGPGILMTDALAKNNIKVPRLPKKLVKSLSNDLEGVAWSNNNPIDLVGDAQADRYAMALKNVKKYDFFDYVIVILTPQAMTQPLKTAKEVVAFASKIQKPVFACFLGGESVSQSIDFLESQGLVVFDEIEEMATTLGYVTKS